MRGLRSRTARGDARVGHAGFTLIEAAFTLAILSLLIVGVMSTVIGIQGSFVEGQVVSDLSLRAQNALDRLVALTSQAVTIDAEYSPLKPTTGVDSHCLRFRLVESIDAAAGTTNFSNDRVYIYGPDSGSNPSAGLVLGRGLTLSEVHANGSGSDGLLGTVDDSVYAATTDGNPVVEILIPNRYAPSNGEMFQIDVNGRLIEFTIRVNARDLDGDFVFAQDLVLTERVALRR